MTMRLVALYHSVALMLAGIGWAQPAGTSEELQTLTRQCTTTTMSVRQMRERATQSPHPDARVISPIDVAAVACTQFTAAVEAGNAAEATKVAAQLRVLYARLNQPPAPPKERLQIMESSASELTGVPRFYALTALGKVAFEAEEIEKSQTYARELLAMADQYPKDWNYGNALYYGYFLLGRVALRQGNVSLATQYLLNSATTPGSPQLNSFGPNVTLAKELLEKGRAEAVLQYFALCKSFWKMDRGRLEEWSATVRAGGTPNFAANLNY
jgi:hypothetical protein